MRHIKLTPFLPLFMVGAMLIVSASCKKTATDEQKPGVATLSALVDGSAWQSSPHGPYSAVGAVGIYNTSMNIQIQAFASDGSYIALNVVSQTAITANTVYTGESGLFQGQFKPDFMGSDVYSTMVEGASGTIRFTNISADKITGTFSFNGLKPLGGSVSVDNGSFEIDL